LASQYFGGDVYAAAFWNRALTQEEITAFSANPWQLFAPRTIEAPTTPIEIEDTSGYGVTTARRPVIEHEMPWREQPQGVVVPSANFTKDFTSAWIFGDGLLARDFVGNRVHLTGVDSPSRYSFTATAGGLGVTGDSSSSSSAAKGVKSTESYLSDTGIGYFSGFGVVTFNAFSSSSETSIFRSTTAPLGQGVALDFFPSTKTIRPLIAGVAWSVDNDTIDSSITAGVPWVIGMYYNGGGVQVYSHRLGDIARKVRAGTGSGMVSSSGVMYIGGMSYNGSSAAFPGTIHLVAVSSKALTESAFQSYLTNPYGTSFAPRTIEAPTASNITIPTLYSPTLTDIEDTTARPNISLTF
jgi:hypothetical protein